MSDRRSHDPTDRTVSRRGALAGAVGGTSALAGCVSDPTDEAATAARRTTGGSGQGSPVAQTGGSGVSISRIVGDGKAIAIAPGAGHQVADPTAFATDDAALQQLVDWSVEEAKAATIHVPHIRPDGSNYVIENQVATPDDDSTPISFQFHGGGESQQEIENRIGCEIDDGDAMFHVSGNIDGRLNDEGDFQIFATFDGLNTHLHGANAGVVEYAHARGGITNLNINGVSGTAIRVAGRSFQGWINRINMGDGDPELDPVGIEFAEGRTGGPDVTNGGDWVVGPAVHIVGKFDACVRSVDGFNRVALGGYYEGGAGTALIEWHTPRLFVTPYAWAVHSQNETGTHGIYVNGGHDHLIAPCYVGNNGGDGIHLTNEVGTFKLWPYTRVRSNGGEGIYVDVEGRWDGDDDPVCIVPHEEGFQDSVTYTDSTDANVLYPNGRRQVASGTVTVPAGGEIALDTVVPFGTTPHVEWTVAADPGGPVKVTQHRQRSEGVDGQRLWFEEHRGETSVQVEYRVELRGVAASES